MASEDVNRHRAQILFFINLLFVGGSFAAIRASSRLRHACRHQPRTSIVAGGGVHPAVTNGMATALTGCLLAFLHPPCARLISGPLRQLFLSDGAGPVALCCCAMLLAPYLRKFGQIHCAGLRR